MKYFFFLKCFSLQRSQISVYLVSFHSVHVMCLDGGLQRQSDLLGVSAWSPLVEVSRPIC